VFFVPIDDPGDGVYVLSINNKLLVKRVEFDPLGQEIRIISENDRYEPRVLKGESMSDVKIEGKVIGWLHRHPY
jgi:Predicted transcriptional regulator